MRRFKLAAVMAILMLLFGASIGNAGYYQGNFTYDTDVVWFSFQQFSPPMSASTSSYSSGTGFDPILALWSSSGQLLAFDDDSGPGFDSYIDGTGVMDGYISLSRYWNFPRGIIGDYYSGYNYDILTPTALTSLTYWNLTIDGVTYEGQVSNPFTTPEPASLLLVVLGLVGVAVARRSRK
jgi:hypothetical protein